MSAFAVSMTFADWERGCLPASPPTQILKDMTRRLAAAVFTTKKAARIAPASAKVVTRFRSTTRREFTGDSMQKGRPNLNDKSYFNR